MDSANVASLIVAVVAAITAIASQRSASKASVVNARTAAEEEAYGRARAMDTATIERLDKENKALREELRDAKKEFEDREQELEDQVEILRWKVRRLEQGLPPQQHPLEEKDDKSGPEG